MPTRPTKRVRQPAQAAGRRGGIFFKILLGDFGLWAVFSGVLTYEVMRNNFPEKRALFGAAVGLTVALVVSLLLKQVANRVVRLSRAALEISRGDLSKPLVLGREESFGPDEVDELT